MTPVNLCLVASPWNASNEIQGAQSNVNVHLFISQEPESSFCVVRIADRVRETVPGGRASNGKSQGRQYVLSRWHGTCGRFRSAEQRCLWLDSETQWTARFKDNELNEHGPIYTLTYDFYQARYCYLWARNMSEDRIAPQICSWQSKQRLRCANAAKETQIFTVSSNACQIKLGQCTGALKWRAWNWRTIKIARHKIARHDKNW